MEISFIEKYEIFNFSDIEKLADYEGKISTPIGNSLIDTLNHLEVFDEFLQTYSQYIKNNTSDSQYTNILDTITHKVNQMDINENFKNIFIACLKQKLCDTETYEIEKIRNIFDEFHADICIATAMLFFTHNTLKPILHLEIPRCIITTAYMCGNQITKNFSGVEHKEKLKTNLVILQSIYKIESLLDYFSAYFKYFHDNKIRINICHNCGNYFITRSKSNEKYCTNASPQNPNKTCREYGARKTYRERRKLHPVCNEHNRTSQFFRSKIRRARNEEEEEKFSTALERYKRDYEKQKVKYINNKLTEDEFVQWIIDQKGLSKKKTKS